MSIGFVNCHTWANNTAAFYTSPGFLAKQTEVTPFLTALAASGLVGERSVALSNMWNLFDFMNVQYVRYLELTLNLFAREADLRFSPGLVGD